MPRSKATTVILVAGIAALVLAGFALMPLIKSSPQPTGLFPNSVYEFGDVVQGTPIEHEFIMRNEKTDTLVVDRIVPTFGATLESFDRIIPPGEEGKIRLRIETRNKKGRVHELASVYTRNPGQPDPDTTAAARRRQPRAGRLEMRGRVVLPVELAPQDRVYFFTVKGQSPQKEVMVINHQDRPLRLLDVKSSNPIFKVRRADVEGGQRYQLTVLLDSATPAGRHEGRITLRTDSPAHPSIPIEARAFVSEEVSAQPDTVSFSRILFTSLDRKAVARRVVQVKKHEGQDFRVLRATADVPFLDIEIVPQESGASAMINLTIAKERAKKGDIQGTLVIETNDARFPRLELPITGTIL